MVNSEGMRDQSCGGVVSKGRMFEAQLTAPTATALFWQRI